jgi:O-antigen/teichoic acid export membrane protein
MTSVSQGLPAATIRSARKPKKAPSTTAGTEVAVAGSWGLIGRVLMMTANLLATPFTIRALGPAQYGLWTVLQTWAAWAVTADVGMGPASTKIGSERFAVHDARGESAVLWTSVAIMAVTTTSMALLVGIPAGPVLHLLGVNDHHLSHTGALALRIVCAIFIAQALAGVVNTPLQVRLRWRGQTIVGTIANLCISIGIPVGVVLAGGGLVTACLVTLAGTAFQAAATLLLSIRTQPSVGRPVFDKAIMRKLLAYGGTLTLSGLMSLPLETADRFFLAHSHTTKVVAFWSVAATLATTLQVLPEQLLAPLVPALARLDTVGRRRELTELYRKALVGMFMIMTPPAILLTVVAHPFLAIWAGAEYGHSATLPFLIAVPGVWFFGMTSVPISYLLATGRTGVLAKIRIWEIVPYVVAAWLLTAKFGAAGAAMTWSGRLALEGICVFFVVRKSSDLPVLPLPTRKLWSVLTPLALCLGAASATIVSHGIILRIGWVVALAIVYMIVIWRLVLAPGERNGIMFAIDDALRRGPPPKHSRRAA